MNVFTALLCKNRWIRMACVTACMDHTVLPDTDTFIHEWNEPSCRKASPHFGPQSFPCPQWTEGWVGL